jgi:hypothetical protein
VAGDIYFWLTDKILTPYTCREDPHWPLCNSSKEIGDNQVYVKNVIEINNDAIGKYSLCNPLTSDPTGHTWHCDPTIPQFGAESVAEAYGNCTIIYHGKPYDVCHGQQFMKWRVAAAQIIGGNWYSTQSIGNCDAVEAPSSCYWRLAETTKIVNATCVNGKITKLVEDHGKSCFDACGPKKDEESDCYITCFMDTALGNSTKHITGIGGKVMIDTMNKAFETTDASKGGCPALPPYTPS